MSEMDLGSVTVSLVSQPTSRGKTTSMKSSMYSTMDQLVSNAPFDVVVPRVLLEGHELLDTALIKRPARFAALTYVEKTTGRHYIIFESPLEKNSSKAKPDIHTIGESVEAISVGDIPAALVVGGAPEGTPKPLTLVWESNGLLLQVTAAGYSLAELQEVALSL